MAFSPKAPKSVGVDAEGYKMTTVAQGANVLHQGWMVWKRLAIARVPDEICDALKVKVRPQIHRRLM